MALRSDWQNLLKGSIESPKALAEHQAIDVSVFERVTQIYPMRINTYFLDLMNKKGMALIRQVVPDPKELEDRVGWEDPLAEDVNCPVPGITHRYPDRVLFIISSDCAIYCRFCTRKRKLGKRKDISDTEIEEGIRYIRHRPEVRDVLLSGGDPLLLSDGRLEWILSGVRAIPHVEIIRIGTRVPSALPQRITAKLVRLLRKYQPLYMNVHVNHPYEITEEVRQACFHLAEGGIFLGSQTVLLKSINDDPKIISELMKQLLKIRVRPYYLLQGDLTRGTDHFRTSIETGLEIMKYLRGNISGMAIPTFMVDLPGGGGKVPLLPEYVLKKRKDEWVFKNYRDKMFTYPQPK